MAVLEDGVAQEARVREGQLRGAHAEQRHAAHGAHHLARVVGGHFEIIHGHAEPGLDLRVGVPLAHDAHAAAALAQGGLDGGPGVAERRHAAHARDDDAAHQTMPPFTPMTWRVM